MYLPFYVTVLYSSFYLSRIYLFVLSPYIYLSPENGILASHIEILTQYQNDFVEKNVLN